MQTKLTNLVDPQVLADMISAELPNAIRLSPLANVDRALEGRPGSTITVPKFAYIGDAIDIAEGVAIDPALLTSTTDEFKIKKSGQAVELTDEAVLSGYGDPIGEAGKQLVMSIASKVDADCLTALGTATLSVTGGITLDNVDAAQALFNDEDQSPMVLVVNPKDALTLRKSAADNWTRASELGDNILVNGAFGEVLGATVIRSRKVTQGTAYLVKQGALAIYMKRDTQVETARDVLASTTVIKADQHYGAHLYDASKVVKITTA